MAISNRAAIFAKIHKVLKKHFSPVEAPERTVLEHLVYACLLENASYAAADQALARVKENAYDWNEVRVTTVTELSETMRGLPDPKLAAMRMKRTLQSVFESQYSFDLEHLKKQNLGKTEKDLAKLAGTTPFAISYLTQQALGGHSIPIDDGALECLYIVGAIDEKEKEARSVPGLERAIPKKSGIEFGSLLHQIGAELISSPYSNHVKDILLEIAPDAQPRLPKRQRKKVEAAPEPEPEVVELPAESAKASGKKSQDKKSSTKKDEAKKEGAKKDETKKEETKRASKSADAPVEATSPKSSKKKLPPAKVERSKGMGKKPSASDTSKKKPAAKQLTRRKPR